MKSLILSVVFLLASTGAQAAWRTGKSRDLYRCADGGVQFVVKEDEIEHTAGGFSTGYSIHFRDARAPYGWVFNSHTFYRHGEQEKFLEQLFTGRDPFRGSRVRGLRTWRPVWDDPVKRDVYRSGCAAVDLELNPATGRGHLRALDCDARGTKVLVESPLRGCSPVL